MHILFHKLPFAVLLLCLSCCASIKQQDEANHEQLLKDVQTLSSDVYEGRRTGTPGGKKARDYILKRFEQLGLASFSTDSAYLQAFTFTTREGQSIRGTNVIGYIKGKMKESLIISAHYDHLGIKNGQVYNGADDNASGTAALLYLAEYYSKHQPNFTLVFTAFDAEEMGLRGAKAFVTHPPLPIGDIQLNINMDMIAHNDKGELYACGTYYYPELKPYITSKNPELKLLLGHDDPKAGHDDWTNQSDQGAFHAKNIPFIYFGVEDHKDYHQATDDFENINPKFYIQATDAILGVIENIDQRLSSSVQAKKNKKM